MSIKTTEDTIAERFACDTRDHGMMVLHDSGLYRHLRFSNPDNGAYWFELVTSPGQLVFGGDMESYVFRRAEDMFEFFRRGGPRPDPGYLAQKVVAGEHRTRAWDAERFKAEALSHLDAVIEEHDLGAADAAQCRAEFEAEVLADNVADYAETALAAANGFEFEYGHPSDDRKRLYVEDVYEWDCTSWNWPFLWALEAIAWGVGQYDATRNAQLMTLLRTTPPLELAARVLAAEARS